MLPVRRCPMNRKMTYRIRMILFACPAQRLWAVSLLAALALVALGLCLVPTPVRADGPLDGVVWASHNTSSVAWGDWDGDGDLDLAVGNWQAEPNKVYLNQEGALQGAEGRGTR